MAFKMKGSPHKMGTIQGTRSTMKMRASSAFQQTDPETTKPWSPAYEGGDHSWEDLENMSTEELKSKFPDAWENILKDLAKRRKSGE